MFSKFSITTNRFQQMDTQDIMQMTPTAMISAKQEVQDMYQEHSTHAYPMRIQMLHIMMLTQVLEESILR